MKRLVDIAIALPAIVISSPILAICAIAIWLEDRGNPLFSQVRTGKNGDPFTLTKLRSMSADTPEVESTDLAGNKITRVGALLRRTNLDEVPQLVAVLKGDMSIVGPRPALPSQVDLLKLRVANGSASIKPGLTGLAQVNSYDNMPPAEKARFDGEYFQSIGLATDAKIIARTIPYLFRRPPKY